MKIHSIIAAAAVCVAFLWGCRNSRPVDPKNFEGTRDGQPTALYVLRNRAGMEVGITNFGGRIVYALVPDRAGHKRDVVLGFDRVEDYFPENNQTDFGASIGRYANRIKDGRISIDGATYQLPQNNFGHCLHGGTTGWQYKVYQALESDSKHLKLQLVSPDGDNGFPGAVTATVVFSLLEDNSIDIEYEAVTDAPTVINMTNHAYFNLSGDPGHHSITEDMLSINASCYTPVDSTFMTTGEVAFVGGTPFDFRDGRLIGEGIDADDQQIRNGHGYDHNWVLDTGGRLTEPAATLYCQASGISLDVFTTEPGIQVYAGNFLDGSVTGKGGVKYGFRSAVCLETQHFPDSPNKPGWPSVVLRPGETYHSRCIYSFSVR